MEGTLGIHVLFLFKDANVDSHLCTSRLMKIVSPFPTDVVFLHMTLFVIIMFLISFLGCFLFCSFS